MKRSYVGSMHLAELASEAQRLLKRLASDISQRRESESILLNEVRVSLRGYKAQRSTLIEGKSMLEKKLIDLEKSALTNSVFR